MAAIPGPEFRIFPQEFRVGASRLGKGEEAMDTLVLTFVANPCVALIAMPPEFGPSLADAVRDQSAIMGHGPGGIEIPQKGLILPNEVSPK